MVLEHIPQHPGSIIITGPAAQPHLLRDSYLDVVDIVPIPQWFKDSIGKTKNQQVLNCLFTQVMVNAVNLAFLKNFVYLAVQFGGRGQVMAKRLFNDDPPPM